MQHIGLMKDMLMVKRDLLIDTARLVHCARECKGSPLLRGGNDMVEDIRIGMRK